MQTGWSPWEAHPYCSMAIIRLSSDIKHLINTYQALNSIYQHLYYQVSAVYALDT